MHVSSFILKAAVFLVPLIAWSPVRAGVTGTWRTSDGDALVDIYACDEGAVCGRIVWMREPLADGRPRTDDKNPSPALRERPVQGLEILRGFREERPGVWSGGRVYDPKSGNEYRGRLVLEGEGTLRLRGYVGIPLFGRSDTWTRAEAPR